MGFNLSDGAEQNTNTNQINWQKPGIHENTKIAKVNLGTAGTGSKYLQFETIGSNGEVGKSPQMYLNTEKTKDANGVQKEYSAWQISARNLRIYIMNTHNVTKEEADAMITGVANEEALQAKVAALLVGRPFRAKFKGVETSKGYIIAELAGSESMKVSSDESKLKYSAENDTVKYKGTVQPAQPAMAKAEENSDLPF